MTKEIVYLILSLIFVLPWIIVKNALFRMFTIDRPKRKNPLLRDIKIWY